MSVLLTCYTHSTVKTQRRKDRKMDWYEQAWQKAEENHDPEEWDGREWDELTEDEKNEATYDALY